jgi:hypothetical protein
MIIAENLNSAMAYFNEKDSDFIYEDSIDYDDTEDYKFLISLNKEGAIQWTELKSIKKVGSGVDQFLVYRQL